MSGENHRLNSSAYLSVLKSKILNRCCPAGLESRSEGTSPMSDDRIVAGNKHMGLSFAIRIAEEGNPVCHPARNNEQ